MDEIERQVVLPKDAQPLASYGRNYAFSNESNVVATYLIPLPAPAVGEGCKVMLENASSRPCTKEEIAEGTTAKDTETVAGKRRWFGSSNDLPFISDGGCAEVNITYDTTAHRMLSVTCNGTG
ncbi:hypothetical protein [Sphingomonas sp. PAMC 26617]|uniref:hypothetical protein n=1 Tax=Sphingomonas sp. PAMC 26617 TaxID=1112216 RepID=UPI0009DA73E1|nr:hypothetical protein [Sphingomonas sp. PAMC 26617]